MMNDLEICRKIAEIEGEFVKAEDWSVNMCSQLEFGDGANWRIYNPFRDKFLLCELILKHEVSIDFSGKCLSLIAGGLFYIKFESKEELPRTILELIIEAKGG